jgi:hypothetical protein
MAFFLVILPTTLLKKKKKTKIASEITVKQDKPCLILQLKNIFKKIKYFYFKLIFLGFLISFYFMLISKINFKK